MLVDVCAACTTSVCARAVCVDVNAACQRSVRDPWAEVGQGDVITGRIRRDELAAVVAAALEEPAACGVTFEVGVVVFRAPVGIAAFFLVQGLY